METTVVERNGQSRTLQFRPTATDPHVIWQVFTANHHDLNHLGSRRGDIHNHLEAVRAAGRRPLIIDAGANIGASTVWYALTYPDALILAVEPDPDNFALLATNTAELNVRCYKAALAGHPGTTRVVDEGRGAWAIMTAPDGQGAEVPKLTVGDLYREHAQPPYVPYLVKIDIEGGEKDVFAGDVGWVARTPVLIMEPHDWIWPRQGTAQPFLRAVAPLDRDFLFYGENVISIDNRVGHGWIGG